MSPLRRHMDYRTAERPRPQGLKLAVQGKKKKGGGMPTGKTKRCSMCLGTGISYTLYVFTKEKLVDKMEDVVCLMCNGTGKVKRQNLGAEGVPQWRELLGDHPG